MARREVSLLKFVGTVSLGLLTGLSYTLSTVTVPTLLTLPSASVASRAFRTLTSKAKRKLRILTFASAASFALAFILSPRHFRHPYLLYTAILACGSGAVASEKFSPYLFLSPRSSSSGTSRPATTASSTTSSSSTAAAQARRERAARARMEASYEVLGSDSHSDGAGSASGDEIPEEDVPATDAAASAAQVNGEEVRTEVESFIKKQVVRTYVAGAGFLVAVLGIWGDGFSHPAYYHRI